MPMSPRLLRPLASGAFSPQQISGLAVWLDAADDSTVTLNGSTVSEWRDKSGSQRHFAQSTAASQPEYVSGGQNGKSLIRNATNKFLRRESGGSVLSESLSYLGQTTHTIFIAWNPNALSSSNYIFWAWNPADSVNDRLQLTGPSASGANGLYTIDSGAFTNSRLTTTANAFTVALPHVVTFRRDGSAFASWGNGNNIGTATRGSAAAVDYSGTFGLFTDVQDNGNAGVSAVGDLYEVICYDRAVTTTQRQKVEGYLAWKWGLQAQLPSNHPYAYSFPGFGSQARPDNGDALAWESAVYSNSGSVSVGTLAAVNTFCNAIDAASLRDRFYRLNLFAGDGLNAALVPLYRGPSRTGTQYGNTADTNNGPFVSADYVETGASGGFTPGAANSSKYLSTGLESTDVGATGHASFYANETTVSSGDQAYLRLADNNHIFGLDNFGNVRSFWGALTNVGIAHNTGHYLSQRTSATSLIPYRNATAGTSSATNTTATPQARDWYVFASNDLGVAARFVRTRMQGYSIGLSFASGADITSFYDAIHAFNTTLGRQA